MTVAPPPVSTTAAPEVLRRLELLITRRLDGVLHGDHRGLVPGHGTELGETRPYQAGDDVRRIDWNVTARTIDPHIRQTVADRELETWALLDCSASLAYGTAACEKRDLALAVLAAIGQLTQRGGNRIGALLTSGDTTATIPARSGREPLQALLRRAHGALATPAAGTGDLARAVRHLDGCMRRRGLAVVISDFLDDGGWERELRRLGIRHELLVVELVDPRELELPAVGVIELRDPESGRTLEVNSSSATLRARFASAAREHRDQVARAVRGARGDHLVLRTDGDWLRELVRFVVRRRDRIDPRTRVGA